MLIIKIELWPHGDCSRSRELGRVAIANDGSGSLDKGNYKVVCLSKNGKRALRSGTVHNWSRRSRFVYELVAEGIKNAFKHNDLEVTWQEDLVMAAHKDQGVPTV